jgi:hypothetical protein
MTRPDAAKRLLHLCAFAFVTGTWALATPAVASYRIESLYSNLAGWFQYIELRESSTDGRITPLAGSIVTVRHGSLVKQYVIPTDPPQGFPAGGSLIVSSYDDWTADYFMPERFLPTDGGTIDLDGNDAWTFGPLPADGSTALLRSGITAPAAGQSFSLGPFSVHVEFEEIIEYYDAARDHYFVSGSEPDIDAIESGRLKGWDKTGYSLPALTVSIPHYCCSTYGQVAVPVCRYYIPPSLGDSHFFSAFADECAAVAAKFPSFVLETSVAFYVYLPNRTTGECPYPFQPVYRFWNQRADTNHRYIFETMPDSLALRTQMLELGWVPEGPAGVAWCI